MSPSYVTKARGVLSPTFPSSHSTSHPGVRRTNPEKLEKKTTTKIAKLELSLSLSHSLMANMSSLKEFRTHSQNFLKKITFASSRWCWWCWWLLCSKSNQTKEREISEGSLSLCVTTYSVFGSLTQAQNPSPVVVLRRRHKNKDTNKASSWGWF